jgi:NitT/TauT family transport system permease protein
MRSTQARALAVVVPPLLLSAAILAAWEMACRLFAVPEYLVPAPSLIGATLVQRLPELLQSALTTLSAALASLVVAILAAAALALAGGLSPTFRRAFQPIAAVIQVTPVVALGPLFVIWAGLDHPGRALTALGALVAFFPIYSGLASGLASADPDLERLFDLYQASRWRRLAHLQLPASIPYLLQGVKVGGGLAVVGVVVAEFTAGSGDAQGLAWRILESEHQLRIAEMFAALAVLGILGAGLNALLNLGERMLLKSWRGR